MRLACNKLLNRSMHDREKDLKAFTYISKVTGKPYTYPDAMIANMLIMWDGCKTRLEEHYVVRIAIWCLNGLSPKWLHSATGEQLALGQEVFATICNGKEESLWKMSELSTLATKLHRANQERRRNNTYTDEQSVIPNLVDPPHPFGATIPTTRRSAPTFYARRTGVHAATTTEERPSQCMWLLPHARPQ